MFYKSHALVLVACAFILGACVENRNTNNNTNIITNPGGGGPTGGGTSFVDDIIPTSSAATACPGGEIIYTWTIKPATTSAVGEVSVNDVGVVASTTVSNNVMTAVVKVLKAGTLKASYRHSATNQTKSAADVAVGSCTTTPPSGPVGFEITPRGPQTFLVDQFEIYNACNLAGFTADPRITWSKSASATFDITQNMGRNANTGCYQVRVECRTPGVGLLIATSQADPAKSANVELTCRSKEGSFNGMWIDVTPAGDVTIARGQSVQFTGTVRGAPAGFTTQLSFECSRPTLVTCIRHDVTYTTGNPHPVLGVGNFKSGFLKAGNTVGDLEVCFWLSTTDRRAWTCRKVRIT